MRACSKAVANTAGLIAPERKADYQADFGDGLIAVPADLG